MLGAVDLDFRLQCVLAHKPGLSARAIARELRERFGLAVYKADINPVLYRRRDLFQFDGYSPPIWSLVAAPPMEQRAPSVVRPRVVQRQWKPVPGPALISPASEGDSIVRAVSQQSQLYRWQRDAIAAWFERDGRGIVEAVTGTGKSRVATEILRDLIEQRQRALILVPSIALQAQWAEVIGSELGITVSSFIGGGHPQWSHPAGPVTIGVVHSVALRPGELDGLFDVIIADECHRYGAPTFRHALLPQTRWRLGLTATLVRGDDGVEDALYPYFGDVCYRYGYGEARRDGVIAPYGVIVLGVDLTPDEKVRYEDEGIRMSKATRELVERHGLPHFPHGTFLNEVNLAQASPGPVRHPARTYLSAMQRRKQILAESEEKLKAAARLAPVIKSASQALVFTETIQGARSIVNRVRDEVHAESYNSEDSEQYRRRVLARFGEGDLKCVVAVKALDEGIDVPKIDLGVIVSSSRSPRQMIQRMGRVVRRKQDGRGAVFIVMYATDTAEDPFRDFHEGDHLGELLAHAERTDVFHVAELDSARLANQVADWIASSGTQVGL